MGKLGFGTEASRLRQAKRQTHCREDRKKELASTVAFKPSHKCSINLADR